MATARARTWIIQSGPSKWDFIAAVAFRKFPPQKVRMRIQEKSGILSEVRDVLIVAVSHKSEYDHDSDAVDVEGDQQFWGFVGYIEMDGNPYGITIMGEYSTRKRIGLVKEIPVKLFEILNENLFLPFPK